MKTLTITSYSIQELKELYPESYKKVLDSWEKNEGSGEYIPWADEIFASLRATIEAFNGDLKDWSLGLDRACIKVEVYHDEDAVNENLTEIRFVNNKLEELRYQRNNGAFEFPGLCPLTGYSADDAFVEAFYKDIKSGYYIKEALERLAMVYQKLIINEAEYQASEENMLTTYSDIDFDKNGNKLNNLAYDSRMPLLKYE